MDRASILKAAIEKAVANGWDSGGDAKWTYLHYAPEEIIFNHAFARAIWGEEPEVMADESFISLGSWRYHLQEMVIADDPIAYLGAHG